MKKRFGIWDTVIRVTLGVGILSYFDQIVLTSIVYVITLFVFLAFAIIFACIIIVDNERIKIYCFMQRLGKKPVANEILLKDIKHIAIERRMDISMPSIYLVFYGKDEQILTEWVAPLYTKYLAKRMAVFFTKKGIPAGYTNYAMI